MSITDKKPKIVVILGPTASGKSELAVKLAKKFDGEIISADSRQVYKGLNIGSGKITKKEMRGIPHYLLDVASPKKTFTVVQYQKLAEKALRKIIKKDKLPIICGGTGLYIDALIYDYHLPEVPPLPKLRKKLERKTTDELFRQLQKLDARRAKNIDKHNRRRLIRALEIIISTGKPIQPLKFAWAHSHFATAKRERALFACLKIGVKKTPEELKKLIAGRLKKRLKIGMIKEVKNLHEKQNLSWKRLDNLGLEYRYVSRFLCQRARTYADSTQTNAEKKRIIKKLKQEMIDLIEKKSLRYAKRQMTWFKKDKEVKWVKKESDTLRLVKKFLS